MSGPVLAVDNEVIELGVYNFQDIPACARKFADQLEEGLHGEPERVLVVIQGSDGVSLCMWGENASAYEAIGILESAKLVNAESAGILG